MATGDITQRVEGIDQILTAVKLIQETMVTQADLDALTAQIDANNQQLLAGQQQILTGISDLDTALKGIEEDIANIEASTGVDLTDLRAKVGALTSQTSGITAAAQSLTTEVGDATALDAQRPPTPPA